MVTKEDAIIIKDDGDLEYLLHRFLNGPTFAMAFVFDSDDLYTRFFEGIGVSVQEFHEKYYCFNEEKNVHISESEFGFVWISTMGLVATSRATKNKFVNAFLSQAPILLHLLDEAIEICKDERIYDIDSHLYEMVEERTMALFHNLIFFTEILLKAYLSLQGENVPHSHKLKTLLKRTKEVMYEKEHNNTLFHAYIIPMIEREVLHLSSIPGKFREEYVKYDDNEHDTTLIIFRADTFDQIRDLVRMSEDIITGMYYNPEERLYLKQGLYRRLLEDCETEQAKDAIKKVYKYLIEKKDE